MGDAVAAGSVEIAEIEGAAAGEGKGGTKNTEGGGKRGPGILAAVILSQHGNAVAAASEAHAASLAELGRWDEACDAMLLSIHIHEGRTRGNTRRGPLGRLVSDSIGGSGGGILEGLTGMVDDTSLWLGSSALRAVSVMLGREVGGGGGRSRVTSEGAAASMRLQLAAARIKYAAVEARAPGGRHVTTGATVFTSHKSQCKDDSLERRELGLGCRV